LFGDIVGYFFHPGECLDLLRYSDIPIHFIKGNHETLLRDERWQEDASNEMVLAGIQHADSILSNEQHEFLQELPRSLNFEEWGIAVSHDCFHYPGIGHYILFCGQAEDGLQCSKELESVSQQLQIGFLGHTHIPFLYEWIADRCRAPYEDDINDRDIVLRPEARYLINPGSLGQPRDRDNRTAYGLLDLGEQKIFHLRRIAYDNEQEIEIIKEMKIESQKTIEKLQNRLLRGW